jgi:hypothetical protein
MLQTRTVAAMYRTGRFLTCVFEINSGGPSAGTGSRCQGNVIAGTTTVSSALPGHLRTAAGGRENETAVSQSALKGSVLGQHVI